MKFFVTRNANVPALSKPFFLKRTINSSRESKQEKLKIEAFKLAEHFKGLHLHAHDIKYLAPSALQLTQFVAAKDFHPCHTLAKLFEEIGKNGLSPETIQKLKIVAHDEAYVMHFLMRFNDDYSQEPVLINKPSL